MGHRIWNPLVWQGNAAWRYVSRRSDEDLRTELVEGAREKAALGLSATTDCGGSERKAREPQASVSRVPGSGADDPAEEAEKAERVGVEPAAVTGANQEWAADFVQDAAESGRRFRVLSVIDVYTRECLALEVDTGIAGRRVTRVLEGIVAERGRPVTLRCDNGPESSSRHFLVWNLERGINVVHIEPGKPVLNSHVESFHGWLREECLNKLVWEFVRGEGEDCGTEGGAQRRAAAQ